MAAQVDHLVVAAASLEQAVDWCQATLGVLPGPGGEHARMGTHNRLLRVATVDFPRSYLELIAVQPGTAPQAGQRWFDLDAETVRDALQRQGPRLLAYVARVDALADAVAAWQALGLDAGMPETLTRPTPRGLLQWQMALRPDGRRLLNGTLPQLIQWGEHHPAPGLPESGVALRALAVRHPRATLLADAARAIGLERVTLQEGSPNLCAVLETPRGRLRLDSHGL